MGRRGIPFHFLISAYTSNFSLLSDLKPLSWIMGLGQADQLVYKTVKMIRDRSTREKDIYLSRSIKMMKLKRERVPPSLPKGYGLSRVVGGPFPSRRVVYISNLTEHKTLRKIPCCGG